MYNRYVDYLYIEHLYIIALISLCQWVVMKLTFCASHTIVTILIILIFLIGE